MNPLLSYSRALWRNLCAGLVLGLLWPGLLGAAPVDLPGQWHAAEPGWTYRQPGDPALAALTPVGRLAATGGNFWRQAEVDVPAAGRYVIDLRNSSLIGVFHHRVFDAQGALVATLSGGIQSPEPNPFFLRHGRELDLVKGRYRIVTQLDSPVFLAQAEPYLDTLEHYRQNIKAGNALVLVCLGVFIGLGFYYAALSMVRQRMAERMYALFILGNLIWNGMCLLVFPDLLGVRWFYLSSFAILFSNCAYIVFVMALLEIRLDNHPRLYRAGCAMLALMAAAILAALARPNWSLELDRYGVGVFITYGLVAGIACARAGNRSARLYLVAIAAFFVLGAAAISLTRLDAYTVYIEHVGLLAVTVEVILLALVLSYQFGQLHHEKEVALTAARKHFELAHTDALTGLPNRFRLEMELHKLPDDGSLTIIDLDGLKHYNDTHGHARGDELLQRFAAHLASGLGQQALLHRMGGDEFAITCHSGNLHWLEDVLGQAVAALRKDDFVFAGASYGSAHAHEAGDRRQLLHLADSRMYQHKRQGGKSESESRP
ncbi:diguanylate cyclase [Janthinobacterium sp. 17J80-10]|uniref:GGDEF domain-containing protein n=1 Tax=Janthinobacterium sp. 17J80-10 TaxID=2497863 RepID=UPI0019D70595|nr:diguanylate cyclase [Janthinobacterium sp. 17J80-10]